MPSRSGSTHGDMALVQNAIAEGADVNARNHDGDTPLHVLARCVLLHGMEIKIGTLLVSHGADVNAKNNKGDSPLCSPARLGDVKFSTFLLDHGAHANPVLRDGTTPLHHLAWLGFGSLDMVKLLVSRGANVNAKDNNGYTPLDRARNVGRHEMVQYLSSVGAIDPNNSTALMLVCGAVVMIFIVMVMYAVGSYQEHEKQKIAIAAKKANEEERARQEQQAEQTRQAAERTRQREIADQRWMQATEQARIGSDCQAATQRRRASPTSRGRTAGFGKSQVTRDCRTTKTISD